MEKIVSPDIFNNSVKAFFTGKAYGADIEKLSGLTAIEKHKIYMPLQRHTDKIVTLDFDLEPKIADAVITNRKGLLIGVQVADCVPILLHDPRKNIIGAVHAGWRGTAAGILKATLQEMCDRFYSNPSDIIVAIGPSIRWCCYEVGHEVIDAVIRATDIVRSAECGMRERDKYYIKKGEKYCLDLQNANKYQALSMGLTEQNIWLSEECTFCLPDKYYSYRYSKGSTGRQGGFIGLI